MSAESRAKQCKLEFIRIHDKYKKELNVTSKRHLFEPGVKHTLYVEFKDIDGNIVDKLSIE